MRNLLNENPELSRELIAKVELGNKRDADGETVTAREIYLEAWDRLPDPKENWEPFSQWIADCLFGNYIDSNNYEEAEKWAEASYKSRPDEIETSCLVQLGLVNYEMGKIDAALDWFGRAYAVGKYRAFQGFDKKYFDFFKKNKR